MNTRRDTSGLFQSVFDNFAESLLVTDPERVILYANPACERITGYSAGEMLGKTPTLFKSGETPADTYRDINQTLASGRTWKGEFINRRKNGESYVESKTIATIRDSTEKVLYYLAIGEEFPENAPFRQLSERLPALDPLTGLPDRDTFLRTLVDTLRSAARNNHETVVFHVDIDDFGEINDSFGPYGADRILSIFAARMKEALRQNDLIARIGNDEFAILLFPQKHVTQDNIKEVAERLLESIRRSISQESRLINVTASIGFSCFPEDGQFANELFSHAMTATTQVKSNGGNAFSRFDTLAANRKSLHRELLSDLHQAIESNELVVHYQPQVSLASGAIVGVEALIRWRHPIRGNLSPDKFIPLAEPSNLIIDIGNWVLREACRQIRAWIDDGLPPIKVAVNLAARHFVVPDLPASIAKILAEYAIEPRLLEIEITESAMMKDAAIAISNMEQLKALGMSISLDDFGTGYSSLAYLSRFPIDVVKIDQSFIHHITSDPTDAAIALATIAMSHKLGKLVLAEGVETEEQMHYLRRNDCDQMQGFFFSRPLPAKEAARLFQESDGLDLTKVQRSEPRHTVLLVDDEADILASLKRILYREGYEILMAGSAAEGFKLLATHDVQLIVSDQRMPEMNGSEFLARVKSLYPKTVRMVLSGYSDISAITDAINKGAVYRFLLKPWDNQVLKEEISGALRHWKELYASQDGGTPAASE